jgi:hypothetical protein
LYRRADTFKLPFHTTFGMLPTGAEQYIPISIVQALFSQFYRSSKKPHAISNNQAKRHQTAMTRFTRQIHGHKD